MVWNKYSKYLVMFSGPFSVTRIFSSRIRLSQKFEGNQPHGSTESVIPVWMTYFSLA
jgi:hypothetical protein